MAHLRRDLFFFQIQLSLFNQKVTLLSILPFTFGLNQVKMNHQVNYLGQKSFRWKVIV